jgi:O-antigen/teichoic acid export membrane protein
MQFARATLWNLAGLGTPVLLAVLSVPVLIHNLGQERYGLLGLLWTLLGTAGLFDLGLGRALTVSVSAMLASPSTEKVQVRIKSGMLMLALVGMFFATLVALLSGYMASYIKRQSVTLEELHMAVMVAAPAILLVVINSGTSSSIDAFRRFDYSNMVRILVAAGTIGGAVLASYWTSSLVWLALVLVVARMLSLSTGLLLLRRLMAVHPAGRGITRADLFEFVHFGRWITAGNLLNPMLAFGDRLLLPIIVSSGLLAYYLVPYDIVTKVLVLSSAVVSALFPLLSATSNPETLAGLLRKGVRTILIFLLPALLLLVMLAHFGLAIWISPGFADHGYRIAQILCIGALFNGVATLPFTFLQSQDMARRIVFVQLFEIPVYLIALYLLGSTYGPLGVAIAWSGRMVMDSIMLWILTSMKLKTLQQ